MYLNFNCLLEGIKITVRKIINKLVKIKNFLCFLQNIKMKKILRRQLNVEVRSPVIKIEKNKTIKKK